MKYRHKLTGDLVEIVTFDELVAIGREQNPGREGVPWSFYWNGKHVSHETDHCYLVGAIQVRRGDYLGYNAKSATTYHIPDGLDPEEWEPVKDTPAPGHSEAEVIEATEKSARMMLDMAALAKEAGQLKTDLEREKQERNKLETACNEFVELLQQRTSERDRLAEHSRRCNLAMSEQAAKVSALEAQLEPLKLALKQTKDQHATQGMHGNWDYDPYMHGMFNGLELALSQMENRRPLLRKAPEEWLAQRKAPIVPVALDPSPEPPADPSPDQVWCQVEGTISPDDFDCCHVILTESSGNLPVALILCNRQPDGTFTPIARGFLPTYKIPG